MHSLQILDLSVKTGSIVNCLTLYINSDNGIATIEQVVVGTVHFNAFAPGLHLLG